MTPDQEPDHAEAPPPAARRAPKSPITLVLDTIGNVWFGVTMLVLILLYCWLGSAGTTPIYHWVAANHFEKTEMEWYAWWPFNTLLSVLGLSLILVTVRKIPFNKFTAGVWTVHAGILVLLVGCAVYFGTKLEGDLLVFRHRAVIQVGDAEPVSMLVRRGETAMVPIDADRAYQVTVSGFTPNYELLTGEHAGKKTFATMFDVTMIQNGKPGEGFVRQVLTGYPQFTEDVIPGKGRAIKAIGRRKIDEKLAIKLEPAPSRRLFLANRPALLARRVGASGEWSEWPLDGLPRYREYIDRPEDVPGIRMLRRGKTPPALSLRPARTHNEGEIPDDVSVRVTGYLPFARLIPSWEAGGNEPYPFVRFNLKAGKGESTFELLAKHPERSARMMGGFAMRFEWCETAEQVEKLRTPARHRVIVRVKNQNVEKSFPFDAVQKDFVKVEGTPYSIKLGQFYPEWKLATGKHAGESAAVAMIDVVGGPKGKFRRSVVSPQKDLSQDTAADGGHAAALIDEGIEFELRIEGGGFVGLTVVGGPAGTLAIMSARDGVVRSEHGSVGQEMVFSDGPEPISVTVTELSDTSRRVQLPILIPLRERNPKDQAVYSLIQAEVTCGDDSERVWLEYSPYSYPSRRESQHHQVQFNPVSVTLGGEPIELLYSRVRLDLPHDVVLDRFAVEQYPGKREIRNYISRVRFADDAGGYGAQQQVSSNNPAAYDGWWYFQSTWDPPDMNFTGLGVGNRHGILAMLLGSIMIVIGTFFAFYIKPVLIRRHKERIAMKRADRGDAGQQVPLKGAVTGLLLSSMAMLVGCGGGDRAGIPLSVSKSFAESVDFDKFRLVAVQEGGRVKTVDSLAREKVKWVNPKAVRAVDPVLFYLDMVFAARHYELANVIYIKKKHIRRDLVQGVRARVPAKERAGLISDAELNRVLDTGMCSLAFLFQEPVSLQLRAMSRDLMRTAKEVNNLHGAMNSVSSGQLRQWLRVIPPPLGDAEDPWFPLVIASPQGMGGMPADDVHRGVRPGGGRGGDGTPSAGGPAAPTLGVPGLDPKLDTRIVANWQALERAWAEQDAAAATTALDDLAVALGEVKPDAYPKSGRLSWEHWYHKNHKLTWTWILYLGAVAFLLMAVVFRYPWARKVGLLFFVAGFGFHSLSIGLRWYLAGRIPNANMFEAIVASAWFGCLIALILEYVLRRWTLKSVPAFCAATFAMLGLMVGHFSPIQLPSDITTVAPLLDRTVWLYIHTNLVIASYALIFFGGVAAITYLAVRVTYEFAGQRPHSRIAAMWLGETGDAPVQGGAASVILSGGPKNDMRHAGLAKTLDGATMIFMELGFISLWVGTILGAIWADVSWGRPWGWDPKEVFALNTWLIFLILIHVRLKTKDKALWTAMLAVIGCGAMLFNWIAVNFVIVGLHSYA